MAGDAFLRFMTDTASTKKGYDKESSSNSMAMATKNNINNIENLAMTQDEVRYDLNQFYVVIWFQKCALHLLLFPTHIDLTGFVCFIVFVHSFMQWLASGITNAEAAEAEVDSDIEHARSLMEKAIYCFKQADNDAFQEKARIQLKSFEFRLSLFESDRLKDAGNSSLSRDNENADAKTEKAGAELLSKLLKENLLLEARGLSRDMAKLLETQYPSSPYLERFVVQQLPEGGSYKDAH